MAGVNKVIILGNLGKDPEVRHLESGKSRVTFSVATSESYKNREGERVTTTEWHNVVLWSPLADIAALYLSKGKQVYIEGKIISRSYDDKEGNTRYITEIVGRDMTLLGSKNDDYQAPAQSSSSSHASVGVGASSNAFNQSNQESKEDDLPF